MIPLFPKFKNLELTDRKEIEEFTKQFPPYHDFEFITLWTYDTEDKYTISLLHNNLVIKILDFKSGAILYSFLGTNNVKDTITALFIKSREDKVEEELKLIPEINIKSSPELLEYFSIKEDPDNFDYILSVNELADLKGGKYYDKRNLVNRFKRLNPEHSVKSLDLNQEETRQDIRDLFLIWEKQKERSKNEIQTELAEIERLFDYASRLNILGLGIYIQDKLIGFATYHIIQNNYAIISVEKGDTTYKGIYEYINHEVAKQLKALGAIYINFEQDIGIPGLRQSKTSWNPCFFFKKYTISKKII